MWRDLRSSSSINAMISAETMVLSSLLTLLPSSAMKSEASDMSSMPSRWGCSNCDVNTTVPAVNNFRGTCKHIICENCILRVINRKKLFTKKTSERKTTGSSVIEAICPCTRCRGTIQVSQVWYEEKNSSVISLCDDEEDQCTAAVAQVRTEIKAKASDDGTIVCEGIERRGLKPLYEKGDAVYALWKDNGSHGWYPGKILSYEHVDSKSRYGSTRKYLVKFDDGDVGSSEDYNVFLKDDYLLGQSKGFEWKWKGVTNAKDSRSSDVWAKEVGWYVADVDGTKQKFSTLVGALRAYDSSVIKKKGNLVKDSDLNLKMLIKTPSTRDVGRDATPQKRERANMATPSPLLLSPSSNGDGDDDESRFSEQEVDEERMIKRIKLDRDIKIRLPDPLEGDQKGDQFWSARNDDIEFTEDAFMKKKSIFHLNSDVNAKMKQNKRFGHFVEQGIATPWFWHVPEEVVPKIADMTQNELRDALIQEPSWGASGAGQIAMWLKRVEVGSFVVMRHEYEKCPYTPEWLKEKDDSSGKMEYVGPVYIIGVVTRKIKPYSQEEAHVHNEILHYDKVDEIYPLPHLCLVDWQRIGYKDDLKEETQNYINHVCQPTVANICNDFQKVYTDGATAASLRQDLWDNSSPCEFVA